MKTILLFFAFSFFTLLTTNAQFKPIAESSVFEEPTTGAAKIVQLKSGNTFFIYLNTKKNYKFFFHLYNNFHKKIKESNFSLDDPNQDFSIINVFEINGDLTVVLAYYEKYSVILFRILIDGITGVIKEHKSIADAGTPTPPAFTEEAFAGRPPQNIYTIPNSDGGYSLIMLRNATEKNRIDILQFDQNHKEIRKSSFSAPEESYKYMYLSDVAAINKDKIALICYSYNTRSSGGKGHALSLYELNLENSGSTVNKLPFAGEEIVATGIVRYNPNNHQLIVLFATEKKKNSRDYTSYISAISSGDKKIIYTKEVSPTAALQKSNDLFSNKKNKINSPLNLFINKNGGFSVIYEDIDYPFENASGFQASYTANMGNIAVQQFDASGKETGSYLVPKNQDLYHSSISLHYQKRGEGTFTDLDEGKQYKLFTYLEAQNKNYILLNDTPENIKNIEKGKISKVSGIGGSEAFFINISGTNIIPERNYLLQKANSVCLFSISDYDESNNIFVTLRLEKGGRNNGVSLVWLQPQ